SLPNCANGKPKWWIAAIARPSGPAKRSRSPVAESEEALEPRPFKSGPSGPLFCWSFPGCPRPGDSNKGLAHFSSQLTFPTSEKLVVAGIGVRKDSGVQAEQDFSCALVLLGCLHGLDD